MTSTTADRRTLSPGTQALVLLLFSLGIGWRLAPIVDGSRRMSQWPTEDGYFMLTMGRNVALGHGLSVAGGETPTNGTQPLTTFVWAAGYALGGTERETGVLIALVLQLLASIGTALALRALVKRVFRERPNVESIAWLAAGFWLASPMAMPHTMNCLETGFYGLMTTLVALAVVSAPEGAWSWRRTLLFGVLLGLAFWVRNDSAFLIAAACLVHLWPGLRDRPSFKPRLLRVLAFGATSVVVASPWLIHNYLNFGHIMPVSGRAEALTGHFAGNLPGLPIVLVEYLLVALPIPHAISAHPAVIAGTSVAVLVAVVLAWRARTAMSDLQRRVAALGALYLLGLCGFYGLYFGAAWFLPRYFLPASPFLLLFTVGLLTTALDRLPSRVSVPAIALPAMAGLLLAAMTFVSHRQFAAGRNHPHFQVVRWVEENVDDDTWVGAIQTGTLGFFHDRTVNLDGKVNIAAYEALVEGREGEYVVEDTEIQYLVDWVGMRDWLTKPAIAEAFELVVFDEEANLAALRRRAP